MARQYRQRKPKSERRIERSYGGRLKFRQGDKHPLDVQFEEARKARAALDEQLTHFSVMLEALAELETVPERMEEEEQALQHFLEAHYQDHKHVEHLEATFLWLRRRRALARLQAAQSALQLAQELLAPDPFVPQLMEILQTQPAEEVEVDRSQLTGHAQAVHDQLGHFEQRLGEIQEAISRGNGWIESFYVTKKGVKPAIIRLAVALRKERQEGTPVPPHLLMGIHPDVVKCLRENRPIPKKLMAEVMDLLTYGPYFKFRWREGNSPIYTISLGRHSDEAPEFFSRPRIRFSRT